MAVEMQGRWKPGIEVPAFAQAAVNAGRFVKIIATKTSQGDYQINQCGAGDRAFGVAQTSSTNTGDDANYASRRVNVLRAPAIARVEVGATIDASSGAVAVKSDANGKAIPQGGTGTIVGYALHSAATTDEAVEVALINA